MWHDACSDCSSSGWQTTGQRGHPFDPEFQPVLQVYPLQPLASLHSAARILVVQNTTWLRSSVAACVHSSVSCQILAAAGGSFCSGTLSTYRISPETADLMRQSRDGRSESRTATYCCRDNRLGHAAGYAAARPDDFAAQQLTAGGQRCPRLATAVGVCMGGWDAWLM